MFTAALFIIVKTWKQPKCPSTEEWIKKMWHMYIYTHIHTNTHNGILLSHNNISQRKTHYSFFTYMWNVKDRTNGQIQQNRNRLTDTENNLIVARREGVGGWAK